MNTSSKMHKKDCADSILRASASFRYSSTSCVVSISDVIGTATFMGES